MGLLQEFKEFAVKGNAVDMAVGIIIGGAFGGVVKSLVGDVIMPPIGALTGGVDFSDLAIKLPSMAEGAEPVTLGYGVFINSFVNFFIVAIAVFALVKGINRLRRKEEAAPPPPHAPTVEETLLTEIRDLLRQQNSG